MLDDLFTISSEFSPLNLAVGLSCIGATGYSIRKFSPYIQKLLDEKLALSLDRNIDDKSSEPLHHIFYNFNHSSVTAWLNWILVQEANKRNLAFQKLKNYLEQPIDSLGAVTKEAAHAVATFNLPESFQILQQLLINSRNNWSQYKTIENFYEAAALELLKLNEDEGFKILREELNMNSFATTNDGLRLAIISAIATIENPKASILDFWISIVLNTNLSYKVRQSALEQIKLIENDLEKYNSYLEIFHKFLKSTTAKLSESDELILERLFSEIKPNIATNDESIWDLLIGLCQKNSSKKIVSKLLADYISYPDETITANQLLPLIGNSGLDYMQFQNALYKRFRLNSSEINLIESKIEGQDPAITQSLFYTEKSNKTKKNHPELNEEYSRLEELLIKANQKDPKSFLTLIGESSDIKLYLLKILAANLNRNFIYLDLERLIVASQEINSLETKLNNYKPAIIYLDKVKEFLLKDLSKDQRTNVKQLVQVLINTDSSLNTNVVCNLAISRQNLQSNQSLVDILDGGTRGLYQIATSFDKLDLSERRRVANHYLSKIDETRINESFDLDAMLTLTESMSKLEYINYLEQYFKTSLLLHGAMINIAEVQANKEILEQQILDKNLANELSFV